MSVAFDCPIEGRADPGQVADDAARLATLGMDLVALGDATGLATPPAVRAIFSHLIAAHPATDFVAHVRDTRGTGIANCIAALDPGCRRFDTSFGGVGSHPARMHCGECQTGIVATEDLVRLLEASGAPTGIDLDRMMEASRLWALHGEPGRTGTEHPGRVPSVAFQCHDGTYLHISGSDQHWPATCDVLALRTRKVPAGEVNSVGDILSDPHIQACGMVGSFTHAKTGPFPALHIPLRETDAEPSALGTPTLLGADTDQVLRDRLGLDPAAIAALRAEGAIG